MPKTNNDFKSKIETYLSGTDHDRFISLCRQRKAARAAIAREAIRWYLDNLEQIRESKTESEISRSIKCSCHILDRADAQHTNRDTCREDVCEISIESAGPKKSIS